MSSMSMCIGAEPTDRQSGGRLVNNVTPRTQDLRTLLQKVCLSILTYNERYGNYCCIAPNILKVQLIGNRKTRNQVQYCK